MGFVPKYHYYVLSIMVLLPALCYSQYTFTCSRATYYGSPDCLATPTGACGFGEYGRTANNAKSAGVSRLWRHGAGCGACYQVRCKVPELCTDDGVEVVVTDYGEGDHTDFILSPIAYGRMANPEASAKLYAFGVVDVEFRRIPCRYNGYIIRTRIHEHSNYPHYLAIVLLYVPGQYDVIAVEIWLDDGRGWVPMRRAYGVVFDIANLPNPTAPIIIRLQYSGSSGLTWAVANNAIPSDWKAGDSYDTAFQLE